MFDALTVAAVADELNTHLVGAKVQQVAHTDQLSLAFEVYAPPRRRWLVLSADHERARVVVHDERVGVDPERVTPLLLLLRKYARGGRIVSVSQPRYERILRVSIAKHLIAHNADNERGDEDDEGNPDAELVHSELIVEMMGRRSNIILVDETGRIREAVKRVTPDMSRVRVVLPGRPFELPPQQNKLEPIGASVNDLLQDAVLSDERLDRWLVGRFQAVSPLLAREVAFRAGLDASMPARGLQPFDAERVTSALDALLLPLETAEWQPMTYLLPNGSALAAPLRLLSVEEIEGMTATPQRTISAAVVEALRHTTSLTSGDPGRHAARRERLVAEIEEQFARAAQRIRSLEEQQTLAAEADTWRAMGEAIYAATGTLHTGMREFTTHEGVTVPLDPDLSPNENAARYFERYRKARSATENVPERIAEAGLQRDYLAQLLLMARQAQSFDEIESVRHEWQTWQEQVRPESSRKGGKKPRRAPGAARRPRAYRTERGDALWVGRTGPQNEQVTFDVAGPGDLWLHARNMPGAHVILRWNGPDDDEVLERAAALAAWYSDGRGSTSVPVDVTERRFVRKLRGGGPGLVTYRNERTLNARPRSEAELNLSGG